jgi:hypothetical protein
MTSFAFEPLPDNLTPEQQAHWLRRQAIARNTLEIQALAGTTANAETLAFFQRYVCGEATLEQAIAQVREQMAQEHQGYRQFLDRRNIL